MREVIRSKLENKSDLLLPFILTFCSRAIGALGGLMLVIVLGRFFGATGLGVFALGQSIYLGSGIIARFGLNNTLIRYVGQNSYSGNIYIYLRRAILKSLILSVTVACLVYFSASFFSQVFKSTLLATIIPSIAIAIPAFTLSYVLSGFLKGIHKPATACLLENSVISMLTCVCIIIFSFFKEVDIVDASYSIAISAWLVLGMGVAVIYKWHKNNTLKPVGNLVPIDTFNSTSLSFFLISLSQLMQQVVGLLIAGWLLSSYELGLFRSAERMAFLISFVLTIFNAIYPAHFARLYHQEKLNELNYLARKGSYICVLIATPLMFLCLIFPEAVLSLFGDDFTEAAPLLRIIAIAQMINVAAGPVNFLLNMTGHEKAMRNIAIGSNIIGLLGYLLLIPLLQEMGAALSLALVLVLQSLLGVVFAWVRLDIWVLPIPNFLRLFNVKGGSYKQ